MFQVLFCGIRYVWNNDTCKCRPNINNIFSICCNTDTNTFTNTIPIQPNTDKYNLKPQNRPIQAPIQTNAQIIVFITCASAYANTGIAALVLSNHATPKAQPALPAPSPTSMSEVSERLSLPSSTRQLSLSCLRMTGSTTSSSSSLDSSSALCEKSQTFEAAAKSPSAYSAEWRFMT